MTTPAYKLAELEAEKIHKPELKLVFKQFLEVEDYQKLAHFVWVKKYNASFICFLCLIFGSSFRSMG